MSINNLNNCIKRNRANHSRVREAIYILLMNSDECLNVSQIIKELSTSYPKKLSQNTIYRHLNFFIECKLVIVIQDDFKRAYYYLKENTPMLFCICTTCTRVTKLPINESVELKEFTDAEFITIHKICNECNLKI
ncbi:transcriptional repressor [Sulfurimonas sp.]|uniref:transcriptional repressor n=1 Tax=Sulfurimonas sp. TaxID=2022749 RepID=UPI002B46745E|nr:transcriptional repressor [Sulfurimonas sp.]